MSGAKPQLVELPQSGHYSLQDGLEFQGLVRPKGKEIIRIRLAAKPAKILDIPLSQSSLEDLIRALTPLHGDLPTSGAPKTALQDALSKQQKVVFLE